MRPAPFIPPRYPLQIVGELYDRELRRKRKELREKFPDATKSEIEKKLNRWLGRKPPIEGPDFVKVPRSRWPKEWRVRPKPASKLGKRTP